MCVSTYVGLVDDYLLFFLCSRSCLQFFDGVFHHLHFVGETNSSFSKFDSSINGSGFGTSKTHTCLDVFLMSHVLMWMLRVLSSEMIGCFMLFAEYWSQCGNFGNVPNKECDEHSPRCVDIRSDVLREHVQKKEMLNVSTATDGCCRRHVNLCHWVANDLRLMQLKLFPFTLQSLVGSSSWRVWTGFLREEHV